MKLLILGGTVFLGRHLVDAALEQNHQVTLFNRGQHYPDLYSDMEKLRGDRDGDLQALLGGQWDAVIDTCGYVPRIVRASAELLATRVNHYTFVSSMSVYSDVRAAGLDETAPVGTLADESVEEVNGETYGPLKVLCEREVERVFPNRSLIIRPGLIVGPHDPSDRFTYWPHRIARGGEVLAPGNRSRETQFIDARDLAEWMIRLIESHQTGTYNATGPDYRLSMGGVLDQCCVATGSDAECIWVDEQFLLDAGVQPWTDLPLWIPDTEEYAGFSAFNISRAREAGLTFRPLATTIEDTLTWDRTRPASMVWRAGLNAERERTLLYRWHESRNNETR